MLLPMIVSVIYNDGLALKYLQNAATTIFVGVVLVFSFRRFRNPLQIRHGFLLITIIWSLLPCFAALPLLSIVPNISFTDAYFEAASGLTASGATVIHHIDSLPPSINFWRGEMSWIGGMGLIVLATAILPILGVGGSNMFHNELPGPIKEQKLTPKITQTAKALWIIYAAITITCAAAYYVAGMNGLDAVIHAFTTVGLGGFSSHDASFAYFDSPLIEAIAIFFMIVAGMNFATHYTAWTSKSLLTYFFSLEWRSYIFLLAFCIIIVTAYLILQNTYADWQTALRFGAFNTISIITTTGYSNTDFNLWPLFAPLFILMMANFTACSGSTGGGIKLVRLLILASQLKTENIKLTHPAAYYDNKISVPLPQKVIISVLFFIIAYIGSAVLLMLFLLATGLDLLTAASAAVATISNTGPGLGEVGPAASYAHLSDVQTWACAFSMLFGRLELMSFLVVLQPNFWRY